MQIGIIKKLIINMKVFFSRWKKRLVIPGKTHQDEHLVFSDPDFHFFIDHLAQREFGLFGFGWALHDQGPWASRCLELRFTHSPAKTVNLSEDIIRDDLRLAFPEHPEARHSGFLIMAGWLSEPPSAARLTFMLPDGTSRHIPLALNLNSNRDSQSQTFAFDPYSQEKILNVLSRSHRKIFLILNHMMGGGSDVYREEVIRQSLISGESVLLFSFHVNSLSFDLEFRSPDSEPLLLKTEGPEALTRILQHFVIEKILINCLVSFPKVSGILEMIRSLQIRDHAKLIIAVHDYFLVCPSAHLLDTSGQFCAIPDMAACRKCLPVHRNGFASLAGEDSPEKWRSAWRRLMNPGTEIICFSVSSRNLLLKAYPEAGSMIQFLPHVTTPLRPVRSAWSPGGEIVIGVIGHISYHKGAQVVADLAKAIMAARVRVRIVVLGTISVYCSPEILENTGSYQREDLPGLAERHHINMVLMPSICPETFSYVTHEVISMGLPLITLNLGAQAGLAKAYQRGRVSDRSDGAGLLQEILDFSTFLNNRKE